MRGIKTMLVAFVVLQAVAATAASVPAQTAATVEQEIRAALQAEQQALVDGGCEAALGFFGDRQPLFIRNGRAMATKAAVRSNCVATNAGRREPRREVQGHEVQVLSATAGYSVTTYRMRNSTQIVTKVWEKNGDAWRIAHSHSSESSR